MIVAVAYLRTGFDIINVPADPALLRSCASNTITFPTLDILNKRFLSSVRVKINPSLYNESWIEQIDYIELKEENSNEDGIFYYVSSYAYTSKDVVTFSIVQDSILSCGGIKIIKTIYAKRAHISKSEDKFGAFDADDEMLMPKEPLQIVHSGASIPMGDPLTNPGHHDGRTGLFFNFDIAPEWSGDSAQETVAVSTVSLAYDGDPDTYMNWGGGISMFGQWGITLDEPSESRFPKLGRARGISVKLPNVCKYVQNLAPVTSDDAVINYNGIEYNKVGIVNYHDSREAMNILRAVGVEDSIIACYRLRAGEGLLAHEGSDGHVLPNTLYGMSYAFSTNSWSTYGDGGEGAVGNNSTRIMAYSEAYDYDYLGSGIHNMRVLYGQFRKYVLASPATGSVIEAKPEELTARRFSEDYTGEGGLFATGKNGAPSIFCFTDPRPTGRPYFNFVKFGQVPKTYGSQQAQRAVINLAEGAIAGGQWPEVPLTFTGMSGEWAARVGYNLDASYRDYLASPDRTYRSLVEGAAYSADRANTQFQGNSYAGANWAHLGVDTQGLFSSMNAGANYGSQFDHAVGTYDEWVGEDAGTYTAMSSSGTVGGGLLGLTAKVVGNIGKTEIGINAARNLSEANARNAVNAAIGAAGRQAFSVENPGDLSEISTLASQGNIAANRLLERQWAAAYERAKFNLSVAYSVPKLAFMSTDSMRDITDNCAYYARYTPTATDLKRMDNILQAFGYKVDMLMPNPINNRSKFVYIEGSVEKFNDFIKVGNTKYPKVIRKDMMLDINNQLANGVRVWKVNPKNADIYDPGD